MNIATKLGEYVKKAGIAEFVVLDSLGLTTTNSLRVTLNRLVRTGFFYNPSRGVYVSKETDPFFASTALNPGYLSLGTALYLHHLTEEYPFTIFVASNRSKTMRLGEHEIRYFKAKNYFGVIEKPYKMASVEKALYDCLVHADLVGYAKIAKALYAARLSAKIFLSLTKGESSAFFQRLGYILSLLPSLDGEKRKIFRFCKKMVQANSYLQGRSKGKYVSDWKIVDNVGEKVILSWWHQ